MSEQQSETVYSPEIRFKPRDYEHPVYRTAKLLPQGGSSNSITLDAHNPETIFELPQKVFNLSKSMLHFNLEIDSEAGEVSWTRVDCLSPIYQIQLYTRGGTHLVDLNDVDLFTKVVTKAETKFEDYMNYPTITGTGNDDDVKKVLACRLLGKNGSPTAANSPDHSGGASTLPILEPTYCSGTATAKAFTYRCKIPLSQIKNTLFDVDKDFYANEVLLLRIVWNQKNKVVWAGTDANSPAVGQKDSAGTVKISSMAVFLAIEQNQVIENSIKMSIADGTYRFLAPWTRVYKINYSASGVQTQQLRLDISGGQRLMKIYHTIVKNSGDKNTILTIDNKAGSKCTSFYTSLNNNRLQDFNVDCTNMEDFMLLQERLKGSVLVDSNIYQYNWFWLDDFADYLAPSDLPTYPPKDNLRRGIPMLEQQLWEFVGNVATSNSLDHYSFVVFQRELSVTPAGIAFG